MTELFPELITKEKRARRKGMGPPYPEGRKCTHDGCITILNTHTKGPYCRAHEGEGGGKK